MPELIEDPARAGLAPSARFPKFVAALAKKYPDSHALEAAGKDAEDAVWSDSPLAGDTAEPFLVLGLRAEMTDRKLMHFIVKTAGAHGLHVFDSATGELWRKDDQPPPVRRPHRPALPLPEQPLMSLHRFARVPPGGARLEEVPPRPKREPDEGMHHSPTDAQRLLVEAIARRLAQHGWREGEDKEDRGAGTRLLTRTLGPARQVLRFFVDGGPLDKGPTPTFSPHTLVVGFGFEIPAVQETLFGLFPAWRRKRAKARAAAGEAYEDIRCRLSELFGIEAMRTLHYQAGSQWNSAWLLFDRDIDWWAQLFVAWYEGEAGPLLGACTDLVTLNRFLNNPRRLAIGMQEGEEWFLMSSLALARLGAHEDVPWENCLTGVRRRVDLQALDERLIEDAIKALEALPPAAGTTPTP